jgi:uncharacterized SAM-dependent methyltransferase
MSDPLPRILSVLKKNKEIPPKYFYFGEGARNWDRFSRDKGYSLGKGEERLLGGSIPELREALGSSAFNLVDLGPGNGYKAGLILKRIRGRGITVTYAALDISDDILRIVRKNISRDFPGLKTSSFQIDFEERSINPILKDLRRRFNRRSLILLLGSGNVTNKGRVLRHVRQAMTSSDFFLMSAELLRPGDHDRILRPYWKEESNKVVFFGLERLGVRESDGHYEVKFSKQKEQVEIRFILGRDVAVGAGGRMTLKKGSRVLLFTSHKPTAASLKRHLEKIGFDIFRFFTDEEGHLALVLCRKRPSR